MYHSMPARLGVTPTADKKLGTWLRTIMCCVDMKLEDMRPSGVVWTLYADTINTTPQVCVLQEQPTPLRSTALEKQDTLASPTRAVARDYPQNERAYTCSSAFWV